MRPHLSRMLLLLSSTMLIILQLSCVASRYKPAIEKTAAPEPTPEIAVHEEPATSPAAPEKSMDAKPAKLHLLEKPRSVTSAKPLPEPRLLFLDTFEYRVGRNNDPNAYKTFTRKGGWHHVKSENTLGRGKGYLYTVDRIPGYKGPFPGKNSRYVLAMESLPRTLGFQTDYYLQYSDGKTPDAIPGDVWFQFWIYPNRYDDPADRQDQLSLFENRFKFIYPCDGGYPCQDGNIKWLNTLGFTTAEPYWANKDKRELFITTMDPFLSDMNFDLAPPYNAHKLGQTDLSENIRPNRWTLVKMHFDTSTTSGTFEAWLKPLGGDWTKVSEWIDGQTPSFTWRIPEGEVGGHRLFRMPTTVDDHDSWIYLDDFSMANSEEALPVYSD